MNGMGKWVFVIIGIVVICLMFPILLTAITGITTNANINDFTGLKELANITPLLAWIAIIGGLGFLGVQAIRRSYGKRKSQKKG